MGGLRNRRKAWGKLMSWLAEVHVDTSQMQVRSTTTWASLHDTWSEETIKVKFKFPLFLSTIPWTSGWHAGNLHIL
jgi:hypothetical protein